jgi:hypothetical protein
MDFKQFIPGYYSFELDVGEKPIVPSYDIPTLPKSFAVTLPQIPPMLTVPPMPVPPQLPTLPAVPTGTALVAILKSYTPPAPKLPSVPSVTVKKG